MSLKRFIVEIGTGADLHGGDVTKAAQKAIKDAVSHSCLAGLFDIVGIRDPNEMHVHVKIACPYPENLNREAVLNSVPFGSTQLETVQGGLSVQGLNLPALGQGDTIVVAVAALTVFIDTDLQPPEIS
ncbi:MAG: Lin0512 family protein [Syntrophomonas sp.]